MAESSRVDQVGHIVVASGVVCHGCGAVVYMSSDSILAHIGACEPLRGYNAERLSGKPR